VRSEPLHFAARPGSSFHWPYIPYGRLEDLEGKRRTIPPSGGGNHFKEHWGRGEPSEANAFTAFPSPCGEEKDTYINCSFPYEANSPKKHHAYRRRVLMFKEEERGSIYRKTKLWGGGEEEERDR